MTVRQQLVGALSIASWRARYALCEYAALAPVGGIIGGGRTGSPSRDRPTPHGMNEVGVTDAVMATLWRCRPAGATYAVSMPTAANPFACLLPPQRTPLTNIAAIRGSIVGIVKTLESGFATLSDWAAL